ncbi:MAG: lytic transglycosylase domain-containing protein [Bacteroidetes bacterium]|nr:lytic transglycosylase domain-containing protein [Bacteroidota bacterium]
MARFFHSVGLTDLSARAATRLLTALADSATAEAPVDLWRLAYPAPFVELVREASDAEGAPDVLVLALLRQESFFDPRAGSTAGAVGLAQVIPPTGREIADALGVESFEVEQLFRPVVSLRFGAYYLQEQMQAFGESAQYALAAYNAGPGNVLRYEGVPPFRETRRYVERVMARYVDFHQSIWQESLDRDWFL